MGGELPFFMPWQQGIGARGLDAVYQVTGDRTAKQLAEDWAKSMLDFGIFQQRGQWVSAKSVEWKSGGAWAGWKEWSKEYSAVENAVEFYAGYMLWMLPGVLICKRIGHDVQKCDEILRQMGVPGSRNERTIEWAATA